MLKFRSFENVAFIALLLLASLAFVLLIQDFLLVVFWAALLASLFHGVQRRLVARFDGYRSVSALLVELLVLVIVVLPMVLIGLAVARESALLYQRISSGEIDLQQAIGWVESTMPTVRDFLDRVGVDIARLREGLSSAAVTASQFVASQAVNIGQNAVTFTVKLFIMLYLLFFFLRDGASLVDALVRVLPLGDERERQLFAKFAQVSRATLKGTLVVAIVQGSIGGVTLALLGFQAALMWGVVMTAVSVLPAVGAALVWVPAAIYLFATGAIVEGIILVFVGVVVIGLVDNLLRPILVGRDTRLPDYLILLSTLGGLAAFGLTGFVAGPVLAALCMAGWEMFANDFAEEDVSTPPGAQPAASDADGSGESSRES